MTKILFQIGLLAFFVSSVVFGLQGIPIFDTITRAFVVFIGTVLIGALVLILTSRIAVAGIKSGEEENAQIEDRSTPAAKKT